jgi:hypothetical protein
MMEAERLQEEAGGPKKMSKGEAYGRAGKGQKATRPKKTPKAGQAAPYRAPAIGGGPIAGRGQKLPRRPKAQQKETGGVIHAPGTGKHYKKPKSRANVVAAASKAGGRLFLRMIKRKLKKAFPRR